MSRRGAHLLAPGAGPCVVPRLRARVAQPRAAQGQQGQQDPLPAAGCAGSGRDCLPHLAPYKVVDCGAADRAAARALSCPSGSLPHASALAAPRSLNDAQVPPGAALFISLPSQKRDSSLHRLSALRLPAGGWGERAKGLGTGFSVTEFPITYSFGPFPAASSPPLTFQARRPQALRKCTELGQSQPRPPGPPSGREPRILHQFPGGPKRGTRLGFLPLRPHCHLSNNH